MGRGLIFFDRDRYDVMVGGHESIGAVMPLSTLAKARVYDRECDMEYSVDFSRDFGRENMSFLELAGEIYYFDAVKRFFRYRETLLYEGEYDANFVSIVYDGMTKLTIEDSEYIYSHIVEGYADIDVEYGDGVFLIRYDFNGLQHIIILLKAQDYVVLLSAVGDEISIKNDEIVERRILRDSLGRIVTRHYVYSEGNYMCAKVDFEYTYDIVYGEDMLIPLIEDAVFAGDYRYIAERMSTAVDSGAIATYIEGIMDTSNIQLLAIEPYSNSRAIFSMGGTLPRLMTIDISLDDRHRIDNLDGGNNG